MTSMPAARQRSTAGARVRRSSPPIQALFARVRVEAGEGKPRARDAEAGKLRVGQADRRVEALRRQQRGDLGERNVHGGENDVQALRVEHHADVAGAGQVGQQVRVAAPVQAGLGPGRLVDRSGGDGVDPARPGVAHGGDDRVVGGAAGGGGEDARGEAAAGLDGVGAVEHGRADRPDGRVGRHERGDLRTDAGRVAGGYRDAHGIRHCRNRRCKCRNRPTTRRRRSRRPRRASRNPRGRNRRTVRPRRSAARSGGST